MSTTAGDKLDMAGPWEAVAIDPDAYAIDPGDDADDLDDAEQVAVVRRTALPQPEGGVDGDALKMPNTYAQEDVLYVVEHLQDEGPKRIRVVLAQAAATAAALNRCHPAPMPMRDAR